MHSGMLIGISYKIKMDNERYYRVRMMSEYITMIENMDVSDLRQISETTFYDTFEGEYSDDDFNQFFKESYNEKCC